MTNIKKVLFIILTFAIISITNSIAQVTIGSLDMPNATLDVRSQATNNASADGIIAPKLTGDQLTAKAAAYGNNQNGVLVYVTVAASAGNQTGKTVNVKAAGYYYYDSASSVWVALANNNNNKPEWFYMPPALINTVPGSGKTINLFFAYDKAVSSAVKSGGTDFSEIVDPVNTESNYDYYVVGYDENVFANISISPAGVMTYDVIGRATDESYINIVFVKKQAVN